MVDRPRVGDIVRHFKGGEYVILGLPVHTETGEEMVYYKSIKNPTNEWVRPLKMFMSEVDHDKYPDVKQKYRFEPIK